MRTRFLFLCLLTLLVAFGCSKPWSNPDSGNKQQTKVKFDRDSTDCEVLSGTEYPLDKHKQLKLYEKCMEDKGWKRQRGSEGYSFGRQ